MFRYELGDISSYAKESKAKLSAVISHNMHYSFVLSFQYSIHVHYNGSIVNQIQIIANLLYKRKSTFLRK